MMVERMKSEVAGWPVSQWRCKLFTYLYVHLYHQYDNSWHCL